MIRETLAPLAALVILLLVMVLFVDLMFECSAREPVRLRHVLMLLAIMLLIEWRLTERLITGTI